MVGDSERDLHISERQPSRPKEVFNVHALYQLSQKRTLVLYA